MYLKKYPNKYMFYNCIDNIYRVMICFVVVVHNLHEQIAYLWDSYIRQRRVAITGCCFLMIRLLTYQ